MGRTRLDYMLCIKEALPAPGSKEERVAMIQALAVMAATVAHVHSGAKACHPETIETVSNRVIELLNECFSKIV